jgi:hypothetical protein
VNNWTAPVGTSLPSAGITQEWAPTTTYQRVETKVKLTDAPDITWRRKAKYGPGRGRPYSIRFEFTRRDGGPWLSNITIYAQRPEGIIGDWFSPEKVYNPPQWLTDIIASASPEN